MHLRSHLTSMKRVGQGPETTLSLPPSSRMSHFFRGRGCFHMIIILTNPLKFAVQLYES